MSSRPDLVCAAPASGFGSPLPGEGGICNVLGAPGKSSLLHGLLLKVFDELVHLLKEDTALAFSSLAGTDSAGESSRVTVALVENNTLPSDQRLDWAWRESTGRWPELSTIQPQVGWWRRMVLQKAPKRSVLGSSSSFHREAGIEMSCPALQSCVCPQAGKED